MGAVKQMMDDYDNRPALDAYVKSFDTPEGRRKIHAENVRVARAARNQEMLDATTPAQMKATIGALLDVVTSLDDYAHAHIRRKLIGVIVEMLDPLK